MSSGCSSSLRVIRAQPKIRPFREHDVEHERIEDFRILFKQSFKRLFACAADLHAMAFGFEIEAQDPRRGAFRLRR